MCSTWRRCDLCSRSTTREGRSVNKALDEYLSIDDTDVSCWKLLILYLFSEKDVHRAHMVLKRLYKNSKHDFTLDLFA